MVLLTWSQLKIWHYAYFRNGRGPDKKPHVTEAVVFGQQLIMKMSMCAENETHIVQRCCELDYSSTQDGKEVKYM